MLNTESSIVVARTAKRTGAQGVSQAEVAQYIREMVKDLHGMANNSGLATLAHMLSIAKLSADETAEELRRAGR
jgi:hypothetical protein